MHSSSATRASAEQTEVERLLIGVDVPSGIGTAANQSFAQRKTVGSVEKSLWFWVWPTMDDGFVPLKHQP